MKRTLACMTMGLFLAGTLGIAQAAGYNAREDCCTEGPPYNRDFKGSAAPTRVVLDQGSRFIEGMGYAPRDAGQQTIVPKVADRRDWCCEDMSEAEAEKHFQKVNKIVPAAGK